MAWLAVELMPLEKFRWWNESLATFKQVCLEHSLYYTPNPFFPLAPAKTFLLSVGENSILSIIMHYEWISIFLYTYWMYSYFPFII